MQKIIRAKYNTVCHICRQSIQKGEQMLFDPFAPKGFRNAHPDCLTAPKKSEPKQTHWSDPGFQLQGNLMRLDLDSIDAFCTLKPHPLNIRLLQKATEYRNQSSDYGNQRGERWWGCSGPDEVRRLAHDGWQAGADKLQQIANLNLPDPQIMKRRKRWKDQGDELNIHRVYSGDISRAWLTTKRALRHAPQQIHLLVNITIPAQIKSEEMFWRGAAILRLADLLTEAGYAVAITATRASTNNSLKAPRRDQLVTFPIKHPDMPLDLPALATATALSGFFRLFGFQATAALPFQIPNHFGWADPDEIERLIKREVIEPLQERGALVIKVPEEVYNKQQAEAFVANAVKQIEEPAAQAA